MYVAVAVPACIANPSIRAIRVTVYGLASAMLVDWAKTIVKGVDVDKVIRSGVVVVGVYVTWYSRAVDPQSNGVAVKDFVAVVLVIIFWLAPCT